jgi:hypothetical protein
MTSDQLDDSTVNMICNTFLQQDGEGLRALFETLLNGNATLCL